MRKVKSLINKIIGNRKDLTAERYFVTVTCFVASIFLFILCIVHIIMNLKLGPVLIAGSGALVLIVLYYFVRFRGCLFIPKLVLTIWGLLMLDLTWYAKYLSNGPVLFYILIFGALVIWVWEGRSLAVMLSIYFLNILVLFYVDYTAPEHLFIYPDTKTRSVDIFLSFILYSSLLILLLHVVKKDFKRETARAIRSDKLKSAFLANMSHEIRTPMNAIVGFSQLLSNGDNPEEKNQYINIIQNSSDNLLRLINDIIDLSKIEAGDMEIKYTDISLQNVFAELKDLHSIELTKKGKSDIDLEFEMPEGNFIFHSDSLRLKQVLSNLLSNAIKFTKKGIISVSGRRLGNEIEFSVSDTGSGIPEEDQARIFEQFTNFDYNGLNSEGSGIGLAIVEKIIHLLNGRVRLDSTPGEGSVFFFTIPFLSPDNRTKPFSNPRIEKLSLNGESSKSILVVEDNELSGKLISAVLESLNYEFHYACNGQEAIDFIKLNKGIRLVLMDMKLPGIDGYEATRTIKEINPNISVIAQTAFAMTGDMEKALNAGCDDYIPKPIDFGKLQEMIRTYLS